MEGDKRGEVGATFFSVVITSALPPSSAFLSIPSTLELCGGEVMCVRLAVSSIAIDTYPIQCFYPTIHIHTFEVPSI